MTHLNKIAQHSARTGMTDRNLAIVWAPNLLRSPALEAGGVAALRGVGVQAVVTGNNLFFFLNLIEFYLKIKLILITHFSSHRIPHNKLSQNIR